MPTAYDRFELLAKLFKLQTGLTAPGKDDPTENLSDGDRLERSALFVSWSSSNALNAALDHLVVLEDDNEDRTERIEEATITIEYKELCVRVNNWLVFSIKLDDERLKAGGISFGRFADPVLAYKPEVA